MTERPGLLATRPEPAARRFAAEAEKLGFDCLIDPMLTIVRTDAPLPDLAKAQAILLTSPAAAEALAPATFDAPVLAVGDATAKAAQDAGFANVESAAGDAAALIALATNRLSPDDGPVIHAAGRRRTGDIVGALEARGFDARVLELYDAVTATALKPETIAAVRAGKIAYAAFFSPQTARTFVKLALDGEVAQELSGTIAVALSSAVAAALEPCAWRRVVTADRPDAAALLDKLAVSLDGAAHETGAGQAE